jgi:two-component system phosphate regulon response regulator PhoB
MVTGKAEEADIVTGLELGADDYVVKPFSPTVLLARVRSVLRRFTLMAPEYGVPISIHGILIHPGRHEVMVEDKALDLTSTEFRLLHLLARRPGWVFSRAQIVQGIFGDDYPFSGRSVDVQIVGLRKKLGSAGKFIETVRGEGYRLKESCNGS